MVLAVLAFVMVGWAVVMVVLGAVLCRYVSEFIDRVDSE